MTLSNIVSEMNKNRPRIKSRRLVFLKGYYLSMYRVYMMRLFDDCYISDPTVFNEKEINKNIAEMSIADMFGYSGSLRLSYDQIRFAYLKAEGSKKTFLENLMNTIKYREMCVYLDKVYEVFNFRESRTSYIRLNLCYQGAKILAKSSVEFNEVTAECLSEFEDEIKTININEYIWCLAMNELGIPREDWQKDGLMDSKLSHKEEVECAEGILNGTFKVTGGKYSETLIEWLKVHPWGNNRVSVESKGLYDYIFHFKMFEIEAAVDAITEAIIKDKDSVLMGMYGSIIYYKQHRKSYDMPIGLFQVINDVNEEEKVNHESTCVYGMTGEFYSIDRLEEDGITYAGCPVLLPVDKEVIFAYDREQTDVQFETWYSFNNADFTFGEDESNRLPKSPFKKDSPSDALYNGYKNSLKSANNLIVPLKISQMSQLEQAQKEVRKFIEGVIK